MLSQLLFIWILSCFQDITLFLPDKIEDYRAEEYIEKYIDPGNNVPHAIRQYSNDISELTISLVDYKNAPTILKSTQKIWNSTKEFDSEEVYVGPIDIKGYPGWQNIQKEIKLSEVTVIVKDRYVITFQCTNATSNEARKLASVYNYNWLRN